MMEGINHPEGMYGCPRRGGKETRYNTMITCCNHPKPSDGKVGVVNRGRWAGYGPDVCGVCCARWVVIPEGVVCQQGPCMDPAAGVNESSARAGRGPDALGRGKQEVWQWMVCLLLWVWALLQALGMIALAYLETPVAGVGRAWTLGTWGGCRPARGAGKHGAPPGGGGSVYASLGAVKDGASPGGGCPVLNRP